MLFNSPQASFWRFFIFYTLLLSLLILAVAFYYYDTTKKMHLAQKQVALAKYAFYQTKQIKELHYAIGKKAQYPRNIAYNSAIYDNYKEEIFSTLHNKSIDFTHQLYEKGGYIYYIKELDDYYLGARYLVMEMADDRFWLKILWGDILLIIAAGYLLLLPLGVYLGRVFVGPTKEALELLDRFIKDTTHEINTPLSAIMANIELFETSLKEPKSLKRLERIKSATKRLRVLYSDLSYATFQENRALSDESIELGEFINQRVEYFAPIAKAKQIDFVTKLQPTTVVMAKEKLLRVVDNLLSNAIKYSSPGKTIYIACAPQKLEVRDEGIGMSKEEIGKIFERFSRFNKSEGGFGLGMNILKSIANEYNIDIGIDSAPHKGTTITLRWPDA